jgi:hypothetical protein
MSRRSRLRGTAALVLACVLGGGGIGTVLSSTAAADDTSTPPPVSVTIPDLSGQTPTPTPTPSSSPSSSPIARTSGGDGSAPAISAPPVHQPDTEPTVPQRPATGTLTVVIAHQQVFAVGDQMTVGAKGFDAGEKVQLVLYYERGKPVKVGNFPADASGAFSRVLVLPRLDAGTDTVQLTGWNSSKVGTGSFLLGASWVAPRPDAQRTIWTWAGGIAGLGAFAALVWFGIASLRRAPTAEVGV